MYKPHRAFLDPEKPFELLWRYMDWPRFFLLLKTGMLFFSSARVLRQFDSFEGSLPKQELDHALKQLNWSIETFRITQDRLRDQIFVSCWHYNDSESIAMWKLYAPTGNGIAIQTTIPEFKLAFANAGFDVYTGKVIYIDYDQHPFYNDEPRGQPLMNGFVAFIHKRQIFSHEREYRAIVGRPEQQGNPPPGIELRINLRALVKRVVVAPRTPDWILNAVQLLVDELLTGVKAERSTDDLVPHV